MALTFPLSLAAFYDLLSIAEVRLELMRQDEHSGMGSGETLAAELAPALWQAEITLDPMPIAEAARIAALIEALDGSIRTFHLANPAHEYPLADPDGSILGAAAPEILSVASGGGALALAGLPAGYQLSAGDFLSFSHGSGRQALHRVVETAMADGAGETADFEVRPPLPAAATAGMAITLLRPTAKMALVPGSFEAGTTAGAMTRGMKFTARERY
ncbi:MAG: hypothetical protein R3D34_06885 [Nitratireductor sp.]